MRRFVSLGPASKLLVATVATISFVVILGLVLVALTPQIADTSGLSPAAAAAEASRARQALLGALAALFLTVGVAYTLAASSKARRDADSSEADAQERARAARLHALEQADASSSTPVRQTGGPNLSREGVLQRRIEANEIVVRSYQEPVRRQARTSYSYAQAAIGIGFLVLIGGALSVLLLARTATAQITLGGLTALGSMLSGYIAATHIRIYDRAQQQLNVYFEEPLVASLVLTAERLAENLSGDRREAVYASMVEQIMLSARRAALFPSDAPSADGGAESRGRKGMSRVTRKPRRG